MARLLRKGGNTHNARRLRKHLTKPELWLWLRIRTRDGEVVFRNQHPIRPYVLDFHCAKARLCVEVDGEVHTDADQMAHDAKRDIWLNEQGIQVHRIIARDLLAASDETADGVITLALERWEALKAPSVRPDGLPPSP